MRDVIKLPTVDGNGAITYRVNVAAAKLGVSRATIYRLVDGGELTLVKLSKRASGITASSLNAHLARQGAAG